jgi:hypothetical protein
MKLEILCVYVVILCGYVIAVRTLLHENSNDTIVEVAQTQVSACGISIDDLSQEPTQ